MGGRLGGRFHRRRAAGRVNETSGPTSTTGNSSTVTFTASATATLGPTTFTVTGTGGGLARTTTITLTVNAAPNFTLRPTPQRDGVRGAWRPAP